VRGQIKRLCELVVDYLLLAFMYEDMQPTRNELANIRFYSRKDGSSLNMARH
jgi:hypothetical protein